MCKVYLDLANWIDLAERNCSVVEFEQAVSAGKVVPILSYIHLLELARQREDRWRGVSKYIDRVRSMGTTLWALLRHTMEQAEVEAAYARFLRLQPPRIRPFRDSLVETLPDLPNEPVSEDLKSESVESQVETVSRHQVYLQDYLNERNVEFPKLRGGALREPRERALLYAPRCLAGSGIFVGEATRQEFAQQVDITELPAFSMCAAYNQGLSRMGGPRLSDFEDLPHLAGIAYCEVGFADGRTCEALKQGRSEISPTRNGQFKGWLATL